MVTSIVRRPATADDLPVCAQFWVLMFEEIGMLHRSDFVPDWDSRFVEYFAHRMTQGEAQFTLALAGERIVGTAGATLLDGYPAVVHGVRVGYIFGVRVEPEFRGKGIATALTRDAIAFLRSRECKRVRLHASDAGRSIYESLGFVAGNEMVLG